MLEVAHLVIELDLPRRLRLIFSLYLVVELCQVLYLSALLFDHHTTPIDLLLQDDFRLVSLVQHRFLQHPDHAVSLQNLLMQVLYLVLAQITSVLVLICILLQALVLFDGDPQLLLQVPDLLAQFQGLLQAERFLSEAKTIRNRMRRCHAASPTVASVDLSRQCTSEPVL